MYVFLLIVCILCVRRAIRREAGRDVPQGTSRLSVVVCVHSEPVGRVLVGLRSIVASLAEGDELLVVGDRPADPSALREAVESLGGQYVDNQCAPGKKGAQRTGVAAARHDTIVCTDADCVVDAGFADAIRRRVPMAGDFMMLLPVKMSGSPTLFGSLVEMEFVCLQMVTAGTALAGFPSMANGAGMVFSRGLYLAHNQHDRYASGDDMFLLQHAVKTGARVDFLCVTDALVTTSAPASVSAYVSQRARWLGKSGGYTSWSVQLVAVVVLLVNVLCPCALLLGFWQPIVVKLLFEMLTFLAGRRLWRSAVPVWVALPLEMLYPLMILVVGVKAWRKDLAEW